MATNPVRKAARQALSKVEFLGCLMAVAGGLWIGSNYLGVDLNGAAYQALDETELLTKLPEEWRPPNPECPDGNCPDPEEIRAAEIVRLRSELEEIRFEVSRLRTGSAGAHDSQESTSLSEVQRETRDRTLGYWQGLSQIVHEVATVQRTVQPYSGTEQHSQALAVRRRALEYGHQAATLLDAQGVDPDAVATGARVAEWYAQGAEKLRAAVELKTSQPVGGRSVSAGELWASTEADLRKRTELLMRKSQETSAYLTSKYFTDFLPLGL